MWRKTLAALGGCALGVLLLSPTASAQHDPTPTTTSTTGLVDDSPTTTRAQATTTTASTTPTTAVTTSSTEVPASTSAPTTSPVTVRPASDAPVNTSAAPTTTAPPAVIVHPNVNLTIVPGIATDVPVDVRDPRTGDGVAFDDDVAPTVSVNGTGSKPDLVAATVSAVIDPDSGELTIVIEVDPDAPPQIVTVTIQATDTRGNTRSLVYLIPVKGGGTTSTTAATSTTAGGPSRPLSTAKGTRFENVAQIPEDELPAVVKQIQAAIPDDATEQALLAQLAAEPESVLVVDYDVDDATLAVSVRPIDASDGTPRGLVAAGALAVATIGLISLRRRNVATVQEVGSR